MHVTVYTLPFIASNYVWYSADDLEIKQSTVQTNHFCTTCDKSAVKVVVLPTVVYTFVYAAMVRYHWRVVTFWYSEKALSEWTLLIVLHCMT